MFCCCCCCFCSFLWETNEYGFPCFALSAHGVTLFSSSVRPAHAANKVRERLRVTPQSANPTTDRSKVTVGSPETSKRTSILHANWNVGFLYFWAKTGPCRQLLENQARCWWTTTRTWLESKDFGIFGFGTRVRKNQNKGIFFLLFLQKLAEIRWKRMIHESFPVHSQSYHHVPSAAGPSPTRRRSAFKADTASSSSLLFNCFHYTCPTKP